ncbi:glycosyltransferase [Trichothermofontia sichuanensis B231]|uniref:glycosyltransferase n=1 Tax=Trichothermofontia sichuanensis TaxID=3045816 RepID=UPI002245C73E|nr:glycosyltransferase [Trichothermofontia sichuanensis]UZQ55314.1 glycosyltransferase [Trichothermofontia sichuanensis B231]
MKSNKRFKLAILDANFYWTEQLFSACSEFADVLLLYPSDFRAFKKLYGAYFIDLAPQPVADHIYKQRICCPPGWLFYYWPLTARLFAALIKHFQTNDSLIFVFSYPYYYTLIKTLNGKSIYYNIDDYRDYWPGRETLTSKIEYQAVVQADLTLCVAAQRAQYLRQTCPQQAARIVHLPHGCSPNFMVNEVLIEPKSLPVTIQNCPRPIAGYIGTLGYRFDFTYFIQVAQALPHVTFVLGGTLPRPADGSVEWWQSVETAYQLANVHYLGYVPHAQLGEYLQAFDVLFMCYSDCNFNRNACPTKLWDYMGTSRPIVANNVVPEVNLWASVLYLASNPSDFAHKLQQALINPGWQASERLAIAKRHTWDQQARKLYTLLLERQWLTPNP